MTIVPTTSAPARGLTTPEARERLLKFGPNEVPAGPTTPWWRRLSTQLRDPLIVVLLVAAALTIATGDHPDAIIIAVVVLANTAVGLIQEIKADHALAALRAMSAPDVQVIRDGRLIHVDTALLVPDDCIVIREGDVVPADAELTEAAALLVDESALTGESVPIDKDIADEVSAGTVVVHGRGVARVLRTGRHSAMGAIAMALAEPPTRTPLQRRLARLGRTLAEGIGVLCLVVMTVGLIRGESAELMVVTAISLAVAAVPESLPAVVTLSLALGARRMAARHAIVRRLPAVEALGSVTVIATDKTGTLTEGAMVAEMIWTPAQEVTLTGVGFDPTGQVLDGSGPVTADAAPTLVQLLTTATLCNDADLQPPASTGDAWRASGDPTEAALVAAALKLPLAVLPLRACYPRCQEAPFDSDRKRMTTIHRTPDGDFLVACKGAPEALLTRAAIDDPPEIIAAARTQADAYADNGYRVLALASSRIQQLPAHAALAEHNLHLDGLVALADPPRARAAVTIESCRAAGITPVLITGDHLATARNVGDRVGIQSVFARTTPAQKLHLIDTWQRAGEVVAMTGDGVNDAPALRHADIGIAMGQRGTDIARQASDMVLTDDDLATVVAAVEEGRRIYANVRRFLLYGLAGGVAELSIMLFGPAFGLALPLLPAQILWVNLLTHGLPGVAMGAEPAEPDAMQRPPRPPAESITGDGLWMRIAAVAAVVTATCLGIGLWAHSADRPWQSMIFLALGMAQFGVALGVRARPGTWRNPFLLLAIASACVLQLSGLYVAPLRSLLHTHALPWHEAAAICATAPLGYVTTRLARTRSRRGTLGPGDTQAATSTM